QQVTSYQNYIAGVQDNLQSNPKNFWSYVKERKQVGEIPTDVSYREEKSTSPEAAANLFARFFETVHSSQDPTVPPEQLNELATYNINLPLLTVSVAEVKKALGSVDAAKGPGPDRIPPSVVKNCCSSLARPVTSIFNRSLSEGAFPSEWKVASITPIHKSGSRAKVENYRSISILSCLAKVLEKLLVDHIYPSVKNIISEYQHGFMKQRSTTLNYEKSYDLSGKPTLVMGDGDGTVNRRSLEACQYWNGQQKQPVHLQEFPGADHMQILANLAVMDRIVKVLLFE
ncbi:hypothetical protein pipiens_018439, partial [Culex pipiens pipiens]